MLQRKQSIWLFIAALLNAGVFYFALYTYHVSENGVDTIKELRVNDHFPSVLLTLVITILPLVTIFMYKKRRRQITMSTISILAIASFVTMTLTRVTYLGKTLPRPTNDSYWIGSLLPVIAMAFVFMAILGIRRDDKLVRSVDRLR
jgi:FtsH-binding integral membrane protein